jgi:hypothetical protein
MRLKAIPVAGQAGARRGLALARSGTSREVRSGPVGALRGLQRTIGNRATSRLVQRLRSGSAPARRVARSSLRLLAPAAPQPMHDGDKSGVGTVGELVDSGAQTPRLQQQFNEDGLLDGELSSDVFPEVFVNNGKTGAARAHFAGGTGGRGDQNAGEIAVVAPVIETAAPAAAGGMATAWVRARTGTATVTRSFTGVSAGANGPDWYVTTRAAARADRHERLHVASSRALHNTHISPLETRIARRTGAARALSSGATEADARTVLDAELQWNAAISAFQTADIAANRPGGTVDATDRARADFWGDYGPRTVRGVAYAHYADIPPGP